MGSSRLGQISTFFPTIALGSSPQWYAVHLYFWSEIKVILRIQIAFLVSRKNDANMRWLPVTCLIAGWGVLNDRVHLKQRHVDGARRLRPVDRQERLRGKFSLLVSSKLFLFFLANKMLTATLANHRARGRCLCCRGVCSTPHLTKVLPREGALVSFFSFSF